MLPRIGLLPEFQDYNESHHTRFMCCCCSNPVLHTRKASILLNEPHPNSLSELSFPCSWQHSYLCSCLSGIQTQVGTTISASLDLCLVSPPCRPWNSSAKRTIPYHKSLKYIYAHEMCPQTHPDTERAVSSRKQGLSEPLLQKTSSLTFWIMQISER